MIQRVRRERFAATIFFGCDPGKSGAIAAMTTRGGEHKGTYLPMPTVGAKEWRFDYARMKEWVHKVQADWGVHGLYGTVEKVHSMPRDGSKQAFTFGRSREALEALMAILEIPYQMVPPRTWKKHYELTKKEKQDSVALAQRLFPGVLVPRNDTKKAAQELEGPAEALLLARYGWERFR